MGKEYEGTLQLASKGHFYDGQIPDGIINVESWGTKEERLLVSPNIDYGETLNRLIPRLTDCPIPPSQLLLGDRQQIFFYLKILSIGGSYSYYYQCAGCKARNRETMDMEKDLRIIYVDDPDFLAGLGVSSVDELTEPFEFTLPKQQKVVGWRLLRGEDEKRVDRFVKSMLKRGGLDERPDYIYRAALRIMTFDGVPITNINDAMTIVESFKGKDALKFRDEVSKMSFGIDTDVEPVCKFCGYTNDIDLPLDKSFFRPDSDESSTLSDRPGANRI